ncbi:patatin-like phospholipase family protein [Massilia sp. METH4]|uniref:patatin-like phospholipase family protein n=1 Tax=Massilia sp. METH4 TaxID=3123041 RepID=UPI0030CD3935
MDSPITLRLGPRARQRIAADGLNPADIAIIPAAAGGPKGLILNGIDTWLFGDWLPRAPRERRLIGASIGAWRMAAGAFADPVAAHKRLAYHYAHQTYPAKVDAAYVTRTVRGMLEEVLGGHGGDVMAHPHHRLTVITARGIGPLASAGGVRWREMAGFLRAAAGNAVSRSRLAGAMERVLFHDARDDAAWLRERYDAFASHFVGLREDNLRGALLASGSIPLVLEAVQGIAGAPPGAYWDGGLIDYHLHLPYQRDPGLVLYPHFTDYIVPGWLDKSMPWRRARAASGNLALDNVILVSPSPSFVARLPNRKLPDRNDFKHYGQDHAARIRDWTFAIGESERMAEALARWVEKPDVSLATAF